MSDGSGETGRINKLARLLSDVTPAKTPRRRASTKPNTSVASVLGTGNVVGDGNSVVNHIVVNPPAQITKVVVKPGDGAIDEAQKVTLKELVDDIVALEAQLKRTPRKHAAVWGALNRKMRVTSYHQIPVEKFAAARKTLDEWRGRLLSAKSAPAKLGDDHRKRRITAIQTRTRQFPNGTTLRLAYLQQHFGVTSLTALDEAQLEQVYRHVFGWKL